MWEYKNLMEISDPTPTQIHSCAMSHFDTPFVKRNYIDLRPLADDRRILRNPHKGWYWHYIDNGYKRGNYRVEHDPTDHMEDFPGLNHLYLRFDWGDIEAEEGKYDWSYIDSIMDEWSRYDYRFSLRICTYEASGGIPFATPEYVFRKGARCYRLSGGRLEPDYGDPIYLEALARFMEEAGRHFNGDPRLELIDVGTYGTWGEGHTGAGSERLYPFSVMKKHIDLHLKNFPDKTIVLNDDHINGRWAMGDEDNFRLLDYAVSHGLGLDDDSVCVRYYAENCGYNSLRSPWLFDYFWQNAPIVLEFEHYASVAPEIFKGGLPFLDAMRRTHATFAGFHGYPRPWLQREPYLSEFCANRLGYWYFLSGMEISELALNAPNLITFYIENRGYSHAYHRYDMKFRLIGEQGQTFTQDIAEADNRTWQPGEAIKQVAKIRPTGIAPGNYDVYLGLFENDRPIEMALCADLCKDGMYKLGRIPVVDI